MKESADRNAVFPPQTALAASYAPTQPTQAHGTHIRIPTVSSHAVRKRPKRLQAHTTRAIRAQKKPAAGGGGVIRSLRAKRSLRYHKRFLCRFDLSRFRRLCFDIFNRRFFFRLPMI